MSWLYDCLARLLAPWRQLPDIRRDLERLERALIYVEDKMATVDEVVARLAAATDEIASDMQALRDEVAVLDEVTAAKFDPLVARLEAMGADPQDPVPGPGEPA